jgi:hypothetical protein
MLLLKSANPPAMTGSHPATISTMRWSRRRPNTVSSKSIRAVTLATVYAVAGGERGLLRTLVDDWTLAPEVAVAAGKLEQYTDPNQMLGIVANLMVDLRCDWGDIMRMVIATAPHDAMRRSPPKSRNCS